MYLSSALPFLSSSPYPNYQPVNVFLISPKLYNKCQFSAHISGRFATNLRYVECEKQVFFDYATLLLFVE